MGAWLRSLLGGPPAGGPRAAQAGGGLQGKAPARVEVVDADPRPQVRAPSVSARDSAAPAV